MENASPPPHSDETLPPTRRRRRLRARLWRALGLALFAAGLSHPPLAGADSAYAPGWSTAHADSANTDYSPVRGAGDLTLAWHRSFDGAINLGATSDARHVYITTTARDGQLRALDPRTGDTRWKVTTFDRSAVASSATLDRDGRVFLADGTRMRALNTDGQELWRTPIVGFPLSAQFTRAGHLLFITHIGRIHVLRRDTGAEVVPAVELIPGATFDPSADPRPCMLGTADCPSANTPAIDLRTDHFYFTFWTPGKPAAGVRAMRLVDAPQPSIESVWINDSLANGSAASPDLSPDGKRLYLTDNGGQLLALDAVTSEVIWKFPLGYKSGGSVSSSPDGIILPAGGGESRLLAVQDKGDHAELLWQRSDLINRGIPTQVAGGLAYATVTTPDADGALELIVVDTATGRILDRERLPGNPLFTVGTTLGLDGTVYVPSIRGDLFAFRPARASDAALTVGEQPRTRMIGAGETATLTFSTLGPVAPVAGQWFKDGEPLHGATSTSLILNDAQPAHAGLYHATATGAGSSAVTDRAMLGLASDRKVIGAGTEVLADVVHPNGNVYDQVLLTGAAASVAADPAQVLRTSFLDVDDDIVQVELSGPGTLSIHLTGASGPAAPRLYQQPSTAYMKGHAAIVVGGATEDTHLSVFTVGRANAVNQAWFRDDVLYDGVADLAYVAITSANGRFGGLRLANTTFFAHGGFTGVFAPDVQFTGPVLIGDITAFDTAEPGLLFGGANAPRITGGDLEQVNGATMKVSGISRLEFGEGETSHALVLPARENRARLEQGGVDVTTGIVTPGGLAEP